MTLTERAERYIALYALPTGSRQNESEEYVLIRGLNSRIATLEGTLAHGNKEWEKLCWSAQDKYANWKQRAEKAESQLSRYREALEAIANKHIDITRGVSISIALEALEEK